MKQDRQTIDIKTYGDKKDMKTHSDTRAATRQKKQEKATRHAATETHTAETHTTDTHATETTLYSASKERHPRRCHKIDMPSQDRHARQQTEKIDMLGSRQRRHRHATTESRHRHATR